MSREHRVVSAGYTPLDIVVAAGQPIMRRSGGTAGNIAAILSFFGWEAVLVGQVGLDPAGEEFIEDLVRSGIRTDQIRASGDLLTPRLVHCVEEGNHKYIYNCPSCKMRFPRSRPLTLEQASACIDECPRASVFFFDRVNHGSLALAEHYSASGAVVVFEPSARGNDSLFGRALAIADVVKYSRETVGELSRREMEEPSSKERIEIQTEGPNGLSVKGVEEGVEWFPALRAPVMDAGGAGDWTTAGFLARVVGHEGIESERVAEGVVFGQALAALACATVGARGMMDQNVSAVVRRAHEVAKVGGLDAESCEYVRAEVPVYEAHCEYCLMPIESEAAHQGPEVHRL